MPVPQFTSLYWPNALSPHKRCVAKYIDTLRVKKCVVKPLHAKNLHSTRLCATYIFISTNMPQFWLSGWRHDSLGTAHATAGDWRTPTWKPL